MQSFSKQNFISVKYNANDEEGHAYYEQFNCEAVPSLIYVNSEGNEVDRIIGFLPPAEYLQRIQDIRSNRYTLSDYLNRYQSGEVNADIVAGIATKYEERGDDENAREYYTILIKDYADTQSDYYQKGLFFLAGFAFESGHSMALNTFIASNPESPYVEDAYYKMLRFYKKNEDTESELSVFRDMLTQYPNDPGMLNSYAWRMTELEMNLEDALLKARRAVELSAENPQRMANIIDTEAEVLYLLKRYDEAIETIERAIGIDPESTYFKDQKIKFDEAKAALKETA
ncbi:MAG: hypothetical protein QGF36_00120 [Candidatus Marinimicrobia bacterium]|nr:hypothetical protein [Candidatus Neomarinimicrobiota bacterium]